MSLRSKTGWRMKPNGARNKPKHCHMDNSATCCCGPTVFGLDGVEIIVEGRSTPGVSASCTGFAKQAPSVKLEVTLVRMSDDPPRS